MPEIRTSNNRLSLGQCATLACLFEATAPKAGNVHPGAEFEDLTYLDFVISATAIAPAMENAAVAGVGATALAAIQATQQLVNSNTNLGTVLLLAPLGAVPRERPLRVGIQTVLESLSPHDCHTVYRAIRLAHPGGLGTVRSMDVSDEPPSDLIAAMRAAADRDMVARQYVNGFSTVLDQVVPWLADGDRQGWPLAHTIVHTQLRLLARYPDSLIARKCGLPIAQEASQHAMTVLDNGGPADANYQRALAEFDHWLRLDSHKRNPGTTADLIAGALFAALRDAVLRTPFSVGAKSGGAKDD